MKTRSAPTYRTFHAHSWKYTHRDHIFDITDRRITANDHDWHFEWAQHAEMHVYFRKYKKPLST